ncbi:MAG: DUF5678 domain-containing protein [Planctomycetaceae bacterium]|nr:DUF5678 domain-containing protein [Planctomycetaceae bacterium]
MLEALQQRISELEAPLEKVRYREPIPMPNFESVAEWLQAHSREYAGQWIALDGDRLVSHGPRSEDVFAAARFEGVQMPYVTFIEPDDALPTMGF